MNTVIHHLSCQDVYKAVVTGLETVRKRQQVELKVLRFGSEDIRGTDHVRRSGDKVGEQIEVVWKVRGET